MGSAGSLARFLAGASVVLGVGGLLFSARVIPEPVAVAPPTAMSLPKVVGVPATRPPRPSYLPLPSAPAAPKDARAGWLVIPRIHFTAPVGPAVPGCHPKFADVPDGVSRWTCSLITNHWLLGHDPGIFAPIVNLRVGDVIYLGLDRYTVTDRFAVKRSDWNADWMKAPLVLQTCIHPDASVILIVQARLG